MICFVLLGEKKAHYTCVMYLHVRLLVLYESCLELRISVPTNEIKSENTAFKTT